jgi:hypothetical protein
MIFTDDRHAEEWAEAIDLAGAHRDDDTVNSYFGASLFIITGVPGLYGRVKQHIHKSWLDFEAMLDMGLSTGERILVALAGNFYNGGFFRDYTPSDIIGHCDAGMVDLAARAMRLRKQTINVNTIFD